MPPQTLYELVNLWRETNTNDQKPSFFLSQKLTESQEDKVRYITQETDVRDLPRWCQRMMGVRGNLQTRDLLLHSTDIRVYDHWSWDGFSKVKLYTYKTIPAENKADFKLKPLKSRFTGISGPYKN